MDVPGASDDALDVLDISVPPEPRYIPVARRSVCRWMLRRHLSEARQLVEFVTSELLAEGLTHAVEGLDLHVEEIDGGRVRVEVCGAMADEPVRFTTIADQVKRRREALLGALCTRHDEVRAGSRVTLWAEVPADRDGF